MLTLKSIDQKSYYYLWTDYTCRSFYTVATHMGNVVLHWKHDNSIIGSSKSHSGHFCVSSWYSSSASLIPRGAFRTIASIFFAYFGSIWLRYSERINIDAYENAAFWKPTRWHSITVDVNIGTISVKTKIRISIESWAKWFFYFVYERAGNNEMLPATWIKSLAAW